MSVGYLLAIAREKAYLSIPARTVLRNSEGAATAMIVLPVAHLLRHTLKREVEIVHYGLERPRLSVGIKDAENRTHAHCHNDNED